MEKLFNSIDAAQGWLAHKDGKCWRGKPQAMECNANAHARDRNTVALAENDLYGKE